MAEIDECGLMPLKLTFMLILVSSLPVEQHMLVVYVLEADLNWFMMVLSVFELIYAGHWLV